MAFSRHDRFGRVRVHSDSHARLVASRSTPILPVVRWSGHKLEAHRQKSRSKTPARGWGWPEPPSTPMWELPPPTPAADAKAAQRLLDEEADAAAARIQATYRGRAVRGTSAVVRRGDTTEAMTMLTETPPPMPRHRLRLLGAPQPAARKPPSLELSTRSRKDGFTGTGFSGTGLPRTSLPSVGHRFNLSVAPAPAPGKKSLLAKHGSTVRSEVIDDMARATAIEQFERAQKQKRSAWGMYTQAKLAAASPPGDSKQPHEGGGGHGGLLGSKPPQGQCEAWGVLSPSAHLAPMADDESEIVSADVLIAQAETELGEQGTRSLVLDLDAIHHSPLPHSPPLFLLRFFTTSTGRAIGSLPYPAVGLHTFRSLIRSEQRNFSAAVTMLRLSNLLCLTACLYSLHCSLRCCSLHASALTSPMP